MGFDAQFEAPKLQTPFRRRVSQINDIRPRKQMGRDPPQTLGRPPGTYGEANFCNDDHCQYQIHR
jgi:hypothetical protein